MKQQIVKFRRFSNKMKQGLHIEWKETIEIPRLIKNKEYKKAGDQVLDIVKMTSLGAIWIIPGGAVLTAMIVKFSHKARPSAFHPENQKEKKR